MSKRVIISGGGTGGHIFPAIAVGLTLKKVDPSIDVLFVGAEGGMEMTLVPKYNFPVKGVTVSGFMRKITLKNILKNLVFPFKLLKGLSQAKSIVREFKPDAVVGFGGFASGPVGRAAVKANVPLILCEANAYAGMTNKLLAPHAAKILLGNEDALRFFDKNKCLVTGNPIRDELRSGNRDAGFSFFSLDPSKKTVLSLGGSLGAGTMNAAWENNLKLLEEHNIQLIWQCGKRYYEELKPRVSEGSNVRLVPFIEKMADAFAMADLVVTRAGGSTLSELIELNKPAILVPSPNVAEDHQTKNAMSLVNRNAGVCIKDVEVAQKLAAETVAILRDTDRLSRITEGIKKIEKHDAAMEIATEVIKIIGK